MASDRTRHHPTPQSLPQRHFPYRSFSTGHVRFVEALNDRLGHDPLLSAALHELLSVVSSVRSTAAILAETPDLEPDWRERFLRNLNTESARLALRAEGLVAFLDGSETQDAGAVVAPQEEVEAWLGARGWRLGTVETPEGQAVLQAEIAALASPSARALAAGFVARAARDATVMPEAALVAALAQIGLDPARLAQQFGCGLMPVFRRLPLMPVPEGAPELGLVLCDGSGTMTQQKPVAGFALPRFGAACPLWPLFTALSRPMTPVEAVVETPANRRFRVLAYAEARYPEGFSGPELREAAMLILPLPAGPAAGFASGPSGAPVIRLGSTCRICPRAACAARREPSILTAEGAGV